MPNKSDDPWAYEQTWLQFLFENWELKLKKQNLIDFKAD
jgi:hypothetical protein